MKALQAKLAAASLCASLATLALCAAPAAAERSFETQINGFTAPSGLSVDTNGNLWVTDRGNQGLVTELAPFPISTPIEEENGEGKFTYGGGYIESAALDASNGDLYVGDSGQVVVHVFNSGGKWEASWGNFGGGYDHVAVDNSGGATGGRVYVSQTSGGLVTAFKPNHAADRFSASEPYIEGSENNVLSGTPTGTAGATVPFQGPWRLAVDSLGDLYVTEQSGHVVDEFKASGEFLRQFKETPEGVFASAEGVAVDPNNGDVLIADTSAGRIYEFTENGEFLEDATLKGTGPAQETPFGSLSGGLAVDSNGYVYVADQSGHIDVFGPNALLPKVTYEPVANQTQTSGTLKASLNLNSGPVITSCKFEYGLSAAYGSSAACSPSTPYSSETTAVSATITGLMTESTYHYRVVVTTANGTKRGGDQTYLPHAVAGLATAPASSVDRNSATLNATFNGDGEDTHYFFEWGTSTAYGNVTAAPPGEDAGSPGGPEELHFPLTGLTVETTYHFRIVASNSAGTSKGSDRSFETLAAVEQLETQAATDVRGSVATLNGSWTGDGSDTHYFFEWGLTSAYGNVSAAPPGTDAGSGTGVQAESLDLADLNPDTTYHFRIVASNSTGVTYGHDEVLTTLALPVITNLITTEFKTTSVLINALVNPNNSGETTYHVEYLSQEEFEQAGFSGATATSESQSIGSDGTDHELNVELTGLAPGAAYRYRVVATSPAGSADGKEGAFTTVPLLPQIDEESASELGPGAVTLKAQVNPGFGHTTYRFQYGPTTEYEANTFPLELSGLGGTDQVASASIEGLIPGAAYHFRIVASNWAGTAYGTDETFETSSAPSLGQVEVADVTRSAATVTAAIKPGLRATTYHVNYGTTRAYGGSTPESGSIGSDNRLHQVSIPVSGLQSSTIYHYRVVASNVLGVASSTDQTFTTGPAEEQPPVSLTCRKGTVKKHGKCAKKSRHRRHHRKGSGGHA